MNSIIPRHRSVHLLTLAVSIVFALPVTQMPAQAAVYKCVADDGSTTYNDTPCAANETIHRLSKTARSIDSLDCRIARNFAIDAVARMHQDDTAENVFDAYGGVNQISVGARELVNHVFSFKADEKLSSKRVVELTVGRCESGLLGKTMDECASFPSEFISRSGGCIAARKSDRTVLIRPNEDNAVLKKGLNDDQAEPTMNAANPAEIILDIVDEHGSAFSTDLMPTTLNTEGPVLIPKLAPAALDIAIDEPLDTADDEPLSVEGEE